MIGVDLAALDDVAGTFAGKDGSTFSALLSVAGRRVWQYQVTPDLGLPVYSVAKSFIAVAVLKLVELGRLSLNDTLSQYFSTELPSWLSSTTIWDLLCHRSGLADYGPTAQYALALKTRPQAPLSSRELYALAFDRGRQFPPGSSFAYSNVGYMLLNDVMSVVTGCDTRDVLASLILEPLNLRHTRVAAAPVDLLNLMPGYSRLFSGEWQDVRTVYHPGWVGHGLIASSLNDLNTFLAAVFGGHLLGKTMLDLVRRPYRLGFKHSWLHPSYGPGFLGDVTSPVGTLLGHNGGGPGWSISSYCLPESPLGITAISVVVDRDEGATAEEVAFALIGKLPRPSSAAAHLRIKIPEQLLEVRRDGETIAEFACSTSLYGVGTAPGSNKTPTGIFRIAEKIGAGAPTGTIFDCRVDSGACWLPDVPSMASEDLVLTRILWLDGLEPDNANTKSRFIYIHGTNDEAGIGQPKSHGCIRMRNQDVISLFDMVEVGTAVECN